MCKRSFGHAGAGREEREGLLRGVREREMREMAVNPENLQRRLPLAGLRRRSGDAANDRNYDKGDAVHCI